MASTAPARTGIGTPLSRVDGAAKVTGAARYAAEHQAGGLLYGVVVSGAIAKGRIVAIDDKAARAVPGVVEVMTHENRPTPRWLDSALPGSGRAAGLAVPAAVRRQDPVQRPAGGAGAGRDVRGGARTRAALVERQLRGRAAQHRFRRGAGREVHAVEEAQQLSGAKAARRRRDGVRRGGAQDRRRISTCRSSITTRWRCTRRPWSVQADGKLTVYDKTQGSQNVQAYLASVFGFSAKDVRVLNPYVGGAFGSGLRPQYQVYLAVARRDRCSSARCAWC